jgi:hypothetical protein
VDERALSELRALEVEDRALTERSDAVRRLEAEVAAIRGRAEEIDAFFLDYPDLEDRLRTAAGAAEAELAQRRLEQAEAERALADAHGEEAEAAARRALARAADHVGVAEARGVRVADERAALEREATALPGELRELAARAEVVAQELESRAPGGAPLELVDWAARARASLFVSAGQLDGQRERVVREANELATMLLGEPTYGATPAQARARVEAAVR